jgi:hypothetical protein
MRDFCWTKHQWISFLSTLFPPCQPTNHPNPTNEKKSINQPTYQQITNKPMFFHRHWNLQWTIIPRVLSWDLTPDQVVVRIKGGEVNCTDSRGQTNNVCKHYWMTVSHVSAFTTSHHQGFKNTKFGCNALKIFLFLRSWVVILTMLYML